MKYFMKPHAYSDFCKEEVYVYNPKNNIKTPSEPQLQNSVRDTTPIHAERCKTPIRIINICETAKTPKNELERKFYFSLEDPKTTKLKDKLVTIDNRKIPSKTDNRDIPRSVERHSSKISRESFDNLNYIRSENSDTSQNASFKHQSVTRLCEQDYQNLSQVFINDNVMTLEYLHQVINRWYLPAISRREAINLVENKLPGSFIVRESTSYRNYFVLTLKNDSTETSAINHFLIENNNSGVRIHDRPYEPFYPNLASLILNHMEFKGALPCKLQLLDKVDLAPSPTKTVTSEKSMIYAFYLDTITIDNLQNFHAAKHSVDMVLSKVDHLRPVLCKLIRKKEFLIIKDVREECFESSVVPFTDVDMLCYDPYSRRLSLKKCFVREKRIFVFLLRTNICHVFVESQDNSDLTQLFSHLFYC